MSIFARPTVISNTVLSFEKAMLLKHIREVTDLPVPNVHLISIIRLMRDENVKIPVLVAAIQRDQALVAKMLKLVNSGLYSLKTKIETVDMAVSLLGLSKVKQIVYSASVMDLFSDEEKAEWDHAYSSSVLMDNILKDNELEVNKALPLAMLLHDIGKVVLRRFSPQKYKMAKLMAKNEKKQLFLVEESMLQISHAEAGSVLMEKWEMDSDIILPVMYHHMDGVPPDYIVETALIQLVNWVDNSARDQLCQQPSKALLEKAGFDALDKLSYVNYQRQLIAKLNEADEKLKKAATSR